MPQDWFAQNAPKGDDWFAKNAPPGQRGSGISSTLLASRQAASKAEFESNQPESTLGSRLRETAIGALQPFDLRNAPALVKSLGGMAYDALSGNASKTAENAKNLITAPFAPVKNYVQAVQSGDYDSAANAAGGILSQTVPAVEGFRPAVKGISRAVLPSAEILDELAAANKARAIAPTTMQGRADAAQIASELSRRGLARGLRGKTIDANILNNLSEAGQRVGTVEDRLTSTNVPELDTSKRSLLNEIERAKSNLNIPRTNITARPEAVGQLNDIHGVVSQLPDQVAFDQLIELRRQLDQRAEDADAYGVNADSLKASLNRGAANMVRGKLNNLDAELKLANHDYSVARKAGDIVQRRQLGDVGKISSGLPSRGGILDDVLATWAGQALGGTPGGALAEAVNLGRQTRGFSNLKSSLQQALADYVRQPQRQPAGLLSSGAPRLTPPASSAVSSSPAFAAPANRAIRKGLLLPAGNPLPPPTELPSGGFEMNVDTGEPILTHEELLGILGKKKKR